MILVFAERSDDELYAQALAFAKALADDLQAIAIDDGNGYAPAAWAAALVDATRDRSPQAVVAPGSERGNEVVAHLGAMLDLPMAAAPA